MDAKTEDGVEKAKMILRSRAVGVVVLRNVVQGNYYNSADLLMTIAPFDHLWVQGPRQRTRRRKSRSRPETESDLSVLRSNNRRQCRLHRQGDRFRLPVRKIPSIYPQSRGTTQSGYVRAHAARVATKTGADRYPAIRHGFGRPVRLRLRQNSQGRQIHLSDGKFSYRSKRTTW